MAKEKKKRSENGHDGPKRMKRKTYEAEMRKLQVKLCHLQEWVKKKGLRVIIAFEGQARALASSALSASFTPPALPRPPTFTCALTTTG